MWILWFSLKVSLKNPSSASKIFLFFDFYEPQVSIKSKEFPKIHWKIKFNEIIPTTNFDLRISFPPKKCARSAKNLKKRVQIGLKYTFFIQEYEIIG